eukprot:GFYU01025253.1.p1 GENE.GFYU01025253.1~~GFYU01025253.1.p1  ORF type:complete len:468 (-),score=87.60 GFYU01025253.1:58-1311(-)
MFIHGRPGSGKTAVVKDILTSLQVPFAYANCVECYTTTLLLHRIAAQLHLAPISGKTNKLKCDRMTDFVRLLQGNRETLGKGTTYLVIDRAERLKDLDPSLLPALMSLSDMTSSSCNLCVILISTKEWRQCGEATAAEPVMVAFSDYSRDDLQTILTMQDIPALDPREGEEGESEGARSVSLSEESQRQLYQNFISLLLNVFYQSCRDLGELRRLVCMLYPLFVGPVLEGKVSETESGKLFKHINPHMKTLLHNLYVRDVDVTSGHTGDPDVDVQDNELELPTNIKYLLIASYLASHNPAGSDVRYFTNDNSRRVRKRRKGSDGGSLAADAKLGGNPFPSERLFSIYRSIHPAKPTLSVDLFAQLSTLVNLNLIAQSSATADRLSSTVKLKCNVSYDLVKSLAHAVDIQLSQYLYQA